MYHLSWLRQKFATCLHGIYYTDISNYTVMTIFVIFYKTQKQSIRRDIVTSHRNFVFFYMNKINKNQDNWTSFRKIPMMHYFPNRLFIQMIIEAFNTILFPEYLAYLIKENRLRGNTTMTFHFFSWFVYMNTSMFRWIYKNSKQKEVNFLAPSDDDSSNLYDIFISYSLIRTFCCIFGSYFYSDRLTMPFRRNY